jgi:hypothetical protein
MASLFEVEDPFGRIVRLDEKRWYDHITRFHPLLRGHVDGVNLTIIEPTGIYADANDPTVECFYKLGALPGRPRQYLKVCVGPDTEEASGFVITAYVTPRIKGTETQLWPIN